MNAQTLAWLAGSADRLSARAPGLAADLLGRVFDRGDPVGGPGPLRLALANALQRAGRFADAEAAAAEALAARGEGEPSGQLRWVLARCFLSQGRTSAAWRGGTPRGR